MPNLSPALPSTFAALADPTRQAVVQALAAGPASVSDLAGPFDMALPSFTQHLRVLEDAGIVVSRKEGRSRICALNPEALRPAEDWLAARRREWAERMDRFEAHLDRMRKDSPR